MAEYRNSAKTAQLLCISFLTKPSSSKKTVNFLIYFKTEPFYNNKIFRDGREYWPTDLGATNNTSRRGGEHFCPICNNCS